MQHRSPTHSSQVTTSPDGTAPLSKLEISPLAACEVPSKNGFIYTSAHVPEPIRYIDNPAFHQPDSCRAILDAPSATASQPRPLSSLWGNDDLAALMKSPLLPPNEITKLFLRMNCLKFCAVKELKSAGEAPPSAAQMEKITGWLETAREIKEQIVHTNARLTLLVARDFVTNSLTLDDLVSIGLESLMRCVDLFDCSKGFRFSTYAGVALRSAFSRAAGVSKSRESVSLTNEEFSVDPADQRENPLRVGVNHAYLQEQISAALAQLTTRDQIVITHRILKEETLEKVGERIGITKEGARLAVLKALKNLRGVMSVDPRDNFL